MSSLIVLVVDVVVVFVYSMSYKVYNNFFNIDMYVNVTNHLYNMASALSHGLFQADN